MYKKKIKFLFSLLLTLFLLNPILYADNSNLEPIAQSRLPYPLPLLVKNKSNIDIYVAIYLKRNLPTFDCKLAGDIHKISPGDLLEIEKPEGEFLYGKKLIFAQKKDRLQKTFGENEYKLISKKEISDIDGLQFYITFKNNVLKCYNNFEWHISNPVLNLVDKIKNKILDKLIKKVTAHKYSKIKANVRIENDLSEQEQEFLSERRNHTQKALEKLLDTTISKETTPNIAFCLSGGGYRAMIAACGALCGAEKSGLLDCATHIVALSGSTWFLAPWISSNFSLEKFKTDLKKKVNSSLLTTLLNIKKVTKLLIKKKLFNQPLSLIDFYGALLATKLLENFGEDVHKICLSQKASNFKIGGMPLPICTAVETTTDYHWFEFTPFEIGNIYLNSYIPSWAFGRKFANGTSKDFAPEQSLGFLMGTFGAALSANFEEIVDAFKESRDIYDLIDILTTQPDWEKIRISPAQTYNFTYGIESSPMQNIKKLTFMDAGVDGGLPFPPLLRKERNIDIIIAWEFSENIKKSSSLKKAENYAKAHNLGFPKIDYSSAPTNSISVFRDEDDPSVPTIIYIPFIKNEDYSTTFDPEKETKNGYCGTFNFSYNEKQFDEVSGWADFTIKNCKDVIIETIKKVIEQKNRLS